MPALSRKQQRLEELLLELPDDDYGMLIDGLDGFVVGLHVCPDLIMPSEWLPWVFGGGGGDDAPELDGTEEELEEELIGLIMQHYSSVGDALGPGKRRYRAIFTVGSRNDETVWEIWIEGFARAVSLRPESWREILESGDEEAVEALTGLVALSAIVAGESELEKEVADGLAEAAPYLIPIWAEALGASSQKRSRQGGDGVEKSAFGKVGRNEPCPCGSGKKYKRCCGMK